MPFTLPKEVSARVWPPDGMSEHLAEIGRVVFCWNVIENTFRHALANIVGGGQKVDILITHVGSNTWLDAMRTIAHHYLPKEEEEEIVHAIRLFELIREYRNFYVHGFSQVRSTIDGSIYWAGMLSKRAKGRFVIEESAITIGELSQFTVYLSAAKNYYASLSLYYFYKGDSGEDAARYKNLPERLPLPERLSKSRRDVHLRDALNSE